MIEDLTSFVLFSLLLYMFDIFQNKNRYIVYFYSPGRIQDKSWSACQTVECLSRTSRNEGGKRRRPAGEASLRSHARMWTSPGGLDLGVPRMRRRDKKKGKQKLGGKFTRDCQMWEAVQFHTALQVISPLILKANPLVMSMIFFFLMIDFVYFFIDMWLVYNGVFISAVQKSDYFSFFSGCTGSLVWHVGSVMRRASLVPLQHVGS